MFSQIWRNKAFTLIEMMIVITIIGLLMVLVLPNMVKARYQAQLTGCQFNLRAIAAALETYKTENERYPPEADWETDIFESNPAYLHPRPKCPQGGESDNYHYTLKGTTDGQTFIVNCEDGLHYLVLDYISQGYPQYSPGYGLVNNQKDME